MFKRFGWNGVKPSVAVVKESMTAEHPLVRARLGVARSTRMYFVSVFLVSTILWSTAVVIQEGSFYRIL